MENQDNIKRELEDLSSSLSTIKKDRTKGFEVPEDYFSKFESKLMQKIENEVDSNTLSIVSDSKNESNGKIILLKRSVYAVVAASLVGLILFFNSDLFQNDSLDSQVLLAQLTAEETNNYILEHIQEYNTEDFYDLAEESILDELQEALTVYEFQTQDKLIIDEEDQNPIKDVFNSENLDQFLDDLSDDELLELEETYL
jgi:hypothetical protein